MFFFVVFRDFVFTAGDWVGLRFGVELAAWSVTSSCAVSGCAGSGVVGYLSIRFLLRYLAGHKLDVFAWYRLALAAVVWWFVH